LVKNFQEKFGKEFVKLLDDTELSEATIKNVIDDVNFFINFIFKIFIINFFFQKYKYVILLSIIQNFFRKIHRICFE